MTTAPGAATATAGGATTAPLDESRQRALDRFFESYYRLRPVNATFTGMHEGDELLPDWSPEGLADARREMSALRRTLAEAGFGVLDEHDLVIRDWAAIDGALADAFLEIQLGELDGRHFQRGNPSLAVGEAAFGLLSLMSRPFAPAEQRAASVVARLRAFPLFFDGVRRTLEGARLPDAWRARTLRELDAGRLLLEQIVTWAEAEHVPISLHGALDQASGSARESLVWFRSCVDAMPEAAVRPRGVDSGLLELLVRRGHWFEGSVDRLRHEAREELETASHQLSQTLEQLGASSWSQVSEQLAQRHPPADGLIASLEVTWSACKARATERDLVTWPDHAVRYVHIPRWARAAAPNLYYLFYRSPAPLDKQATWDYEVADPTAAPDESACESILRIWNDAAIKLNHVVHHGALGHHVQNWYAARAPSRVGRVAAVDCASRIGMFCGGTFAEGWACYATELMESAGFLTPLESAAEQHTRVRLLTRAIVDLELHTGRIDTAGAARLYVEHAALSGAAASAEVVKNSMFPGTAMMYWLGVREIWRMRAEEEAAGGASFSLRAFHDELLSFGSIPVPLAARIMGAARNAPGRRGGRRA